MEDYSLTPPLVKAARALLDWQQDDLARAASLSVTAVKHFERASPGTRPRTHRAIRDALESHGIEFLASGGLRRVDDVAATLRFGGKDFIAKWGNDIYAAVRRHGDEILTVSTDEAFWYQSSVLATNHEYLEWAEKLGLKLKSLVPEGQKMPYRSYRNYRAIAPELIGKITYCVYADRLAFVLWKKKQVIVLRNALVSDTFRNQFLYLWKMAKPVF
jgi:DNA-binding XRE family transcriptional regulator